MRSYFLERPDDILRHRSLLRDFPQEIGQLNSIFVESYDFFQPIKWSLWNVIILKLFRIKPPRELKKHVCQPSRNQTKAPYASSCGMNRPIPSWLMYVTCSFVLMKMKSFSCETFCMSTRSEKEANSNSKVKVKSAYQPSGPSGRRLPVPPVSVAWSD